MPAPRLANRKSKGAAGWARERKATERVAYYPVQVEKILDRYEILAARHGVDGVRARYDQEEVAILDEFLKHGFAVRAEREKARSEGREPDFLPLVESWGGVTQFYRKDLSGSPAYRQNHEEVQKALEEGIRYAPCMSPLEALADDHGHLRTVMFERQVQGDGRWRADGAPVAARKFHPGQFYRIQNLESGAPVVEDTSLTAEALALTGAWVDRNK